MEDFRNHPLYRRHNLDSAMSSLWDFYRTRFLVLFISSFVMSLIIQLLSITIDLSDLTYMTDPAEMLSKIRSFIWPIIIISLLNLLFTVILGHYIVFNPVDSSTNIFVSCYKSVKYFIPFLIIMILFAFVGSFALIAGVFALIIGVFFVALYMVTVYLFFLPVLLVEGTNIGNAISRSFRFAHRGFWTNLGWTAVLVIIIIVISLILSMLIMIPFSGSIFKIISEPADAANVTSFMTNPVYIILGSVANAIVFPLMPVFGTILYFNGRATEENGRLTEGGELPVDDDEKNEVRVEDLYARPVNDEDSKD